ncbi:MAG: 3-methyl-2-oxobutanoate dehydrogenase subunit VorB [Thermoguttaceae bacterium]
MKKLIKGNEAVVLGALAAGCDAFFGYPITPASEISQLAAEYFPQNGKVFLQAECEIGAINMVYGAAVCGKRAFTSSSGPGISLKQECLSFLAGGEVPCVVVDVMRAGPGIGNIGPEQSDYNQVVKGGGHGDYKVIVLAPNSAQEMYQMMIDAFDVAEKYRTPVFILADATLGQMMEPVKLCNCVNSPTPAESDTTWHLDTTAATNDNLITSIYLDFTQMENHAKHLAAKFERIRETEARYETYMTEDADVIFTGYGITSRILKSVVEKLRKNGEKVGMFRPQTLFPFPTAALQGLCVNRNPQFLVVELSTGQYAEDVKQAVPGSTVRHFGRLGGNLPSESEIVEFWKTSLKAV